MEGSSPSRQTVIIDRSTDANVQRCYQLQRFAAVLQQTTNDKGEDAPQHYMKTASSESFKLNLAFARKNHPIRNTNDDKVHVPQEWFEEGDRKLAAHLGQLTKWRNSLDKTGGKGGAAAAQNQQEAAEAPVENVSSEATAAAPNQEPALTTANNMTSALATDPGQSNSTFAQSETAAAPNHDAIASITSALRTTFGAYTGGSFPQTSSSSPAMWPTGAAAGTASGLTTVPDHLYSPFAGQNSETPAAAADRAKFAGAAVGNAFGSGAVPGGFPLDDEMSAQQLEEPTAEELAQEMADNKEMRRWYRQWYARHKRNKDATGRQNRDGAMADASTNPSTPASLKSSNVSAQVDDSLNKPATQKHSRRPNTPTSSAVPAQIDDSPRETESRKPFRFNSKPAAKVFPLPVRGEKPAWKPVGRRH
ncbi:hypothetical protein CcaCcLH18_10112 [Colletotrichum camelliae]|nr:hypothetical protein CcaCcLH18_10112 [Colletotrichum camelliae]